MPGQTIQRLYDITPLVPLLEAGRTLLTPNYRLARRIKAEWDATQVARGVKAWTPASVFPLESWLEGRWLLAQREGRVPPRILLDGGRAREIWLQVIEADQQAQGNYSLLQPGAAAELAARARESLLRWCVDNRDRSHAAEFNLDADCRTFLRWQRAFERRLEEGGLGTLEDCLRELAGSEPLGEPHDLVLLDFDDIPPLYQNCLDILSGDTVAFESEGEPADGNAAAFPDKKAELRAVADWAAALQRDRPGETVGIVLADQSSDRAPLEYFLREAFDCLGEHYTSLPVNFSTGITLDRAPVVRDALAILRTTGDSLPLKEVVALLRSRFTGHRDGASDLAVLLLELLFEEGGERVETGYLRYRCRDIAAGDQRGLEMGEALHRVSGLRLHRRRQPPSAWVEAICEVLAVWGWPGPGPLDSLEFQQVETWYDTLEQFAGYDAVCKPLALGEAIQLLTRCCQGRPSQPRTADSAVQVLGPLEAAGLQFDHLWLCGLQESRWPPHPRPNPFIPVSLQVRTGMPHASTEREWQFASALMARYRRDATTLIASYCTQLDGVPDSPSPLLAGMALSGRDDRPAPPPGWSLEAQGAEFEHLDDRVGPPVSAAGLAGLRGGSGILEDQSNCPFRAFAHRRLGTWPLGDYRIALSPAERGSILHDALYALWGAVGDSERLTALDEDVVVGMAVDAALDAVPAQLRQRAGAACLRLERARLDRLLREWLAVERERAPFRVLSREERLEGAIAGIPLNLRVDRVDELACGGRLVIDYKSGRSSLGEWLGNRPAKPQLPLYGISSKGLAGIAVAQVRPRQCCFRGIGDVEGVKGVESDIARAVRRQSEAPDWEGLLEEWRRNLEALAEAFLAGEAAVDPLRTACDYCGLQPLCRVALEEGG